MISAGSRPSRAASISPRSSRSSGSMNARSRKAYAAASSGKVRRSAASPSSACPSSSIRMNPFSDRLQPRSRAMPRSAMLCVRGPGEMDEVRAGLAGRHDHQVHLRAAQQLGRGLRVPGAQHPLDDAEPGEPRDDGVGVVGLDEQVEVADRLPPPTQGARLDDPPNPGRALELRDEVVGDRLRAVEQQPLRPRLELLDPFEDPLLRARGDALEAAQAPRLGGLAQVLERLDRPGPRRRPAPSAARRPGSAAGRRGWPGSRRADARGPPCGRSWRARRSCRRWPGRRPGSAAAPPPRTSTRRRTGRGRWRRRRGGRRPS